jgi:aminoglycoside phosphotransferase (APT) family kinase protein
MPVPRTRPALETETALATWLTAHLRGSSDLTIDDLRSPRATGFSSETAMIKASWTEQHGRVEGRFVARIEAGGYALFPDIDLRQQSETMQCLSAAGVPTPRVLGFQDEATSPLGQAFVVMEHMDGRIPPDHPPYAAAGWLHDASPDEQQAIYRNGVEQLAQLHAVPWQEAGLSFLLRAGREPGMATELDHFSGYLDWVAAGREFPLLRVAIDWLRAHLPEQRRICVNWGDPKLSNMIFDGLVPIALLDWELAAIAPADADVAFWLVLHRTMTEMRGHDELPGFPSTDDEMVAMYETASGERVHDLPYYKVWAALRVTTILLRVGDMLAARGVIERRSDRAPELAPLRLLELLLDDVGVDVSGLDEWSA